MCQKSGMLRKWILAAVFLAWSAQGHLGTRLGRFKAWVLNTNSSGTPCNHEGGEMASERLNRRHHYEGSKKDPWSPVTQLERRYIFCDQFLLHLWLRIILICTLFSVADASGKKVDGQQAYFVISTKYGCSLFLPIFECLLSHTNSSLFKAELR